MVALSPVVPHGQSAWLPSAICQSRKSRKIASSKRPLLKGVIRAGIDPANMALLLHVNARVRHNERMFKRSPRRAPDRDLRRLLSSTLGRASGLIALSASVAVAAAVSLSQDPRDWYRARLNLPVASKPAPVVTPAPPAPPVARVSDPLAEAVVSWNRLRQSDRLPFSDYSSFLIAHPGWPGEETLRKTAERALAPDSASPSQVIAYFTRLPPLTPAGNLRHAEALMALGRPADAQAAARKAW